MDLDLNPKPNCFQLPKFKYLTPDETAALDDPFAALRRFPAYEPLKNPEHRLSRFISLYEEYLNANQIADSKERTSKITYCKQFQDVVGDIYMDEIEKHHAYQYAQWMSDQGLAYKTIRSRISKVSKLLIRAEQTGAIKDSPFVNITLTDYGRPPVSYLPFSTSEMNAIFAQDIPFNDRLALTLLATTGARLDEIALLKWSQVKDDYGITFSDLRDAKKVKNNQSRRVIPIHSKVAPMLVERGHGRMFAFAIGPPSDRADSSPAPAVFQCGAVA